MLYKVLRITEADFGCEELAEDSQVMSMVKLEDLEGNTIAREFPDEELVKCGIEEGKYMYIAKDGHIAKAIRVVAAVIKAKDEKGREIIFATQRGYGDFKGGWEFPGGKLEPGETPQQALVREIREELDTQIIVGDLIDTIEYDYPKFHLYMDCFWCEVISGDLVLKEHEAARWLTKEELNTVDWLPADVTLIEKVAKKML